MDVYGETNVEYQRVGTSANYVEPREGCYRVSSLPNLLFSVFPVLSIVFYIVHLIGELICIYYLVRSVIAKEDVRLYLFVVLFNAFGIYLFTNGLFGQRNRKLCLSIYIVVFQLAAGVMWAYQTLSLAIGFEYFREQLQKEFDKIHSDANASVILSIVIGFSLTLTCYHFFATWAISKYKKLRVLRDPEF